MTRDEAVKAYTERFGGFPFMSTRGLPDEIVINMVEKALDTDEEISFDFDDNSDY